MCRSGLLALDEARRLVVDAFGAVSHAGARPGGRGACCSREPDRRRAEAGEAEPYGLLRLARRARAGLRLRQLNRAAARYSSCSPQLDHGRVARLAAQARPTTRSSRASPSRRYQRSSPNCFSSSTSFSTTRIWAARCWHGSSTTWSCPRTCSPAFARVEQAAYCAAREGQALTADRLERSLRGRGGEGLGRRGDRRARQRQALVGFAAALRRRALLQLRLHLRVPPRRRAGGRLA